MILGGPLLTKHDFDLGVQRAGHIEPKRCVKRTYCRDRNLSIMQHDASKRHESTRESSQQRAKVLDGYVAEADAGGQAQGYANVDRSRHARAQGDYSEDVINEAAPQMKTKNTRQTHAASMPTKNDHRSTPK